jgi:dUTP pyrophosphatase
MVSDKFPKRATIDSAGYDIEADEDIILIPGKITEVTTSFCFDSKMKVYTKIKLDDYNEKLVRLMNWVGIIVPRSSLGKYGVRMCNTLGVIDSDYPDNIFFRLTSDIPYTIKKGDRFAQLLFIPIGILKDEVKPTQRRYGGNGSTGL